MNPPFAPGVALRLLGAVLLSFGLGGCDSSSPPSPAPGGSTTSPTPRVLFVDDTASSGLDFVHTNGATGQRYIVEIIGAGGGFLDYDGDGDMDVYCVNGARLPGAAPLKPAPRNRLFRNDGHGVFEDVTDGSGVGHGGYGMGMAAGDIDNDGDVDLFVSNYGPDVLYRNRGDGTFEDITETAGVGDERFNSSAMFFDYDRDGDLDLYVCAYLDFDPKTHKPCHLRGHEIYCGPNAYSAIPDRLYRNEGNGRFSDVSEATGILAHAGKGLGCVAGDFDDDGDSDMYIANDGTANFLFINQLDKGEARFEEEAIFYGAAYGESAKAEAGMGVDMGDFDDDGDLDITCTNLDAQTNSLYRNEGGDAVTESSYSAGLSAATIPWVGFGTRFLDHDLDGDLDLFVTNGHIMDNVGVIRQGGQFAQDDMLFENEGGRYTEVLQGSTPRGVGRGLAVADVDDDGDLDILITNNNQAAVLLRNVSERKGGAIGLVLEGSPPASNRDATGAQVRWQAFGRPHLRQVTAGASYCSTHDPRLLLAVEKHAGDVEVEIRWPSGRVDRVPLAPGAYHHFREGLAEIRRTPFQPAR